MCIYIYIYMCVCVCVCVCVYVYVYIYIYIYIYIYSSLLYNLISIMLFTDAVVALVTKNLKWRVAMDVNQNLCKNGNQEMRSVKEVMRN